MEITWQEAIDRAIVTASKAEAILSNPKTPVGAQAIGYAKLAGSWAAIAGAINESIWTGPDAEIVSIGNGHRKP